MDDVFPIVLLVLAVVGGWVLGVVGFFSARRALREVAVLRASVVALVERGVIGQAPPAPAPPPAVPPEAIPPVPEPSIPEPSIPEPAAPEPAMAEPAPVPPPQPPPGRDIEALLTQRWGIWLGAAALLLAGIFLVRYAAEQGMLGPAVRCTLAGMLGAALLAGAEYLRRRPAPEVSGAFGADQAPAALAAGGCAALFGAAYGVGGYYMLVPPGIAFALMAGAAMVGLAASLRFGQLTAAIGVAAAFGTPALLASNDSSVAALFAYLLAVNAAALGVMRWTAWTWLGWTAAIASALWVVIAAAANEQPWAPAIFVPLAVLMNFVLLPRAALESPVGRRMAWLPLVALGLAGLVLESSAPELAPRLGLYLLSPIAVWKGMTEPRLARLPWLAAGLGLVAMLIWALPAWQPTGEAITIEGVAQAVFPGAWAPEVIVPLLITAGLFAAFHAAAGLFLERRAPDPLVWAALPAGVPVMALGVAYAQVALFQPDVLWAAAALALTAALVFTARLAVQEGSIARAGVHGAGAAAALALAYAMVLHDQWLTTAIAILVPALAWIAGRTGVRGLRHVALVAAAVVLVRVLPNWNVLFYPFGHLPVVNGLIVAYAIPAASFAFAAVLFRRVADDLLVAVLEAGAVTLLAVFVVLEIRHAATGGDLTGPGSFTEVAFNLTFLAVQATVHLHLARRTGRAMLRWAWRIEGCLALALGAVLLLVNPMVTNDVAGWPALAAAYLIPGALAALAMRHVPAGRVLGLYAVLAGFVWIAVQIRMLFHPLAPGLERSGIEDAELWSWSGAWLAYGVALLAAGMWRGQRALRQAGLGVVGLVTAKVFLLDMAGLTGLWRVVSFLGLGLALIGLGAAYRRFVLPAKE